MATKQLPETGRARAGSFQTLSGAALAASHLVALRFDPDDVAIAPRDFRVVEPDRWRDRATQAASRGAVTGAAVLGSIVVVATVGVGTLVGVIVPWLLVGAAAGAGIGLVAGMIESRRQARVRFDGGLKQVRPTTFDVVVDREAAGARHVLARWWDPSAPPVQQKQAA